MSEKIENQKAINSKFGILTELELRDMQLFSTDNSDARDKIFERCYSNASFDFTLGDEFFFPKQYQDELEKTKIILQLNQNNQIPKEKRDEILKGQIKSCKANDGILILPKFSSVVISTFEIVTLPKNIAGRFDLRVKWAMAGLVLQVGTQIEPSYSGRLWGLLHNFSGEDVIIKHHSQDHRLLTGEFYFTCEPTKDLSADKISKKPTDLFSLLTKYPVKSGSLQNYFDSIYDIQQKFREEVQKEISSINKSGQEYKTLVSNQIANEIETINRLKDEVQRTAGNTQNLSEKVNERSLSIIGVAVAIIAFGLAIGLPLVIPLGIQWKNNLDITSKQSRDNTDSLKREIRTLENRIKTLDQSIINLQQNKEDKKVKN